MKNLERLGVPGISTEEFNEEPIIEKPDKEKEFSSSGLETEQLEEGNPKELGNVFLQNEENGIMSKVKDIFNVLGPHEIKETALKISGAAGTAIGLGFANISFLHPEQMNVIGQELSSGTLSAARVFSVCAVLLGATI